MKKMILGNVKIVLVGIILSLGISMVYAWTDPEVPPTGNNVRAPLNEGPSSQIKQGNLWISGLNASGTAYTNGLIIENGNVGIGTSTSSDLKLNVNGKINSATGLCIAGVCKTDWSQVGGTSTNYWVQNSNTIYTASSYPIVGIGTTNPQGSGLTIQNTLHDSALRLKDKTNLAVGKGNPIVSLDFNANNFWSINDENSIAARIEAQGGSDTALKGQLVFYTGQISSTSALIYPRMVLDFDGNLGIGALIPLVPTAKLHVEGGSTSYLAKFVNTSGGNSSPGILVSAGDSGTASGAKLIAFQRPDGTEIGTITKYLGTSVRYNTSSDGRLKDNIVNTKYGLNDLLNIKVRDFTWKNDSSKNVSTGFIAQELYNVYPEAVSKPADETKDTWGVDYGRITPLLVKSTQDLSQLNQKQQEEIDSLKVQNQELENRMKILEEKLK